MIRTRWPRPTLTAWLLGFSAVSMLLAALNIQNGWLYLIDAWTWGLLLGSLAFVVPARRHALTCHFPSLATEGEPIPCQVRLESPSGLIDVELRLHESQLLMAATRTASLDVTLPGLARGIHPLPAPHIVRWSPAGLFRRAEEHPSPGQIRVYPRLEELASWPWLALTGAQTQDPSQSVREYRAGDPKRWIHWPTSARRERLFVREPAPSGGNRLAIWLHAPAGSNQGQGRDATLEVAVRGLGSLAQFLLEQGWRVSIGQSGQSGWSELNSRQELLDWLLTVQESETAQTPPASDHQEVVFTLTAAVLAELGERPGKPIVYLCTEQNDIMGLPPTPYPLLPLHPEVSLAQMVQSR